MQNPNFLIRKNGKQGLLSAIGNTALIRINSLSDATGCEIYGKAEFLNPGGSVMDRVAVHIIEEALNSGDLVKGGVVTEGSLGSTAVSLATVAHLMAVNVMLLFLMMLPLKNLKSSRRSELQQKEWDWYPSHTRITLSTLQEEELLKPTNSQQSKAKRTSQNPIAKVASLQISSRI